MSYTQWRQELSNRKKAAAAGEEYKSPATIRAEAVEMRRAADETSLAAPNPNR